MSDPPSPACHRFGARVLDWERGPEEPPSPSGRAGSIDPPARELPVRLSDLSVADWSELGQAIRSVGGHSVRDEGATERLTGAESGTLVATRGQYDRLCDRLRSERPDLPEIGEEVARALSAYVARGTRKVEGAHRSLTLGDQPRVMGILNVTPDSFSDGGRYLEPGAAVAAALRLVDEGASLLDVGGESTRPGATPVSPEAEWTRVGPVLDALRGRVEVPLSIDTRHADVARQAIDAGADIVNDVEGLRSEEMRRVVARSGAAVIVVHMRGIPATMQTNLEYRDLRSEVYRALSDATDAAIAAGIPSEKILVDPGLGFGKSAAQSLELLVHAGEFRSLGYPVVLGASRKSFLDAGPVSRPATDRLEAGLAAAVIAAERGVSLVRTHDVGPTVRALAVVAAIGR